MKRAGSESICRDVAYVDGHGCASYAGICACGVAMIQIVIRHIVTSSIRVPRQIDGAVRALLRREEAKVCRGGWHDGLWHVGPRTILLAAVLAARQ